MASSRLIARANCVEVGDYGIASIGLAGLLAMSKERTMVDGVITEGVLNGQLNAIDSKIHGMHPVTCQMAFVVVAVLERMPDSLRSWLLQRLYARAPFEAITPSMEAAARLTRTLGRSNGGVNQDVGGDMVLLLAIQHDHHFLAAAEFLVCISGEISNVG